MALLAGLFAHLFTFFNPSQRTIKDTDARARVTIPVGLVEFYIAVVEEQNSVVAVAVEL